MKKTLLLFCDFYLPSVQAGGPLRSIVTIIDALKNTLAITVVTRNHDLCESAPYANIVSDELIQMDGYQIIYLSEKNKLAGIRHLLSKNHYDIFYFNSFFSPYFSVIPQFLEWIKHHKARIIISPRGELGQGALTIKSARKKYYLTLFKWLYANKQTEFLASSESEKNEIEHAVGKQFKITTLANIALHNKTTNALTEKTNDQLKIVFISRISKKKNILFALSVLKAVKGNVTFDIYGPIEEPDYWDACLQEIKKLPPHIQVKYAGAVHPDRVTQTLQQYDLFFLPSLNENYGHAIVEALVAGCPVLLSDQTPWHDLPAYNAGWEFNLKNPILFSEKIDALIATPAEKYQQYKKAAQEYYFNRVADVTLADKYRSFFDTLTLPGELL